MKKTIVFLVLAAMLLGLTACAGAGGSVNVQRADQLAQDGLSSQRYAAMVVNEDVITVQKDAGKTILECYVTVGQEVKAGDKLFTYDSEALELELEKQLLELEKMKNEQTTYASQLEKLEKELENTWSESGKVELTLQINVLKTTQLENDYAIATKEKSIADIQATLANIDVLSPIDGTIRKLNETDETQPYITIQQFGAYRLRGSLNEMNMGTLMPGSRIRAVSRVDASQSWLGTVVSIDTANASQDNVDMWSMDAAADMMATSSSYVFHAELDSPEGLLLGQHLYVELFQEERTGLWIPESFLTERGFDEATGMETAKVWAADASGKLALIPVSLGMYDGMTGCCEILEGITGETYLADPADPLCQEGAAVTFRTPEDFAGQEG